jgi:hypothetical protein
MGGATASFTNIGEKEIQIIPIIRLAFGFMLSKGKFLNQNLSN